MWIVIVWLNLECTLKELVQRLRGCARDGIEADS